MGRGGGGEKVISIARPYWNGYKKNWQQNLTDEMLRRLAMERISRSNKGKCCYDGHDQQLDCFDKNSDLDDVMIDDDFTEEVEMQSTKSKGHYHLTNPHLDRVISDFKSRRPLSVIRLQKGEYGCILCGNKFIPVFVEYLSGSQTMTVSVSFLNGSGLEVSCCSILQMHL